MSSFEGPSRNLYPNYICDADRLQGCQRDNPCGGGDLQRLSHVSKFYQKMAPVETVPVVKKATFQDNVKGALKGGKASAKAVLKVVAAERNFPVEKCCFLVKVTLKRWLMPNYLPK